jgi:hypothetical protein
METTEPDRDGGADGGAGAGAEEAPVRPIEETEAYAEAADDDTVLPELSVDPPPGPGPQRPKGRQ